MSKDTYKRSAVIYAVTAGVFIITAALGSFFDLSVSSALYRPIDPLFLTITILGQFVPFASANLFTGALFGQVSAMKDITPLRKNIYRGICIYLTLSTGIIGSNAMCHSECLSAVPAIAGLPQLPVKAAVLLICFIPPFIIGSIFVSREYSAQKTKKLILMIAFASLTVILISPLKGPFARPRYRTTLMGLEGVSFRPWYDSAGDAKKLAEHYGVDKNDFQSFPSGHAVMGMMSAFLFPAYFLVWKKLKGKELMLTAIGIVYGALVMLSRIVLGAHFLSDVSIGALAGLVAAFIILTVYYKLYSPLF